MCEYLIYRRLHGHCSTTLADDLEEELRVRDNNPSQERNWQRSEQCRVQRRGRPHETNLLRVHTIRQDFIDRVVDDARRGHNNHTALWQKLRNLLFRIQPFAKIRFLFEDIDLLCFGSHFGKDRAKLSNHTKRP